MPRIVLYGATGYTGKITARLLTARSIDVLLAGRNREKLSAVSESLGGTPYAVVDTRNPRTLAALMKPGDVLVSTVGPFVRVGDYALEAARLSGAHYIDSTGEPAFVRAVFEKFPVGSGRGQVLMPAMGYDYVPGHCAAAAVLDRAGGSATRLEIGYFTRYDLLHYLLRGKAALSGGTLVSIAEALYREAIHFNGGRLFARPIGLGVRAFPVQGSNRLALAVPGSEAVSLPRVYSQLRDVNGYNGWFGRALTLVFVTYMSINRWLLKVPGYARGMLWLVSKLESGGHGSPGDNDSIVVAQAYSQHDRLLATATMAGVEPYAYTGKMLAWAAEQLANGEYRGQGAIGPLEAFGSEALLKASKDAGIGLASVD